MYKLIHLYAKLEDDDADEDGDDAVAVTPGGILSQKTSPRNPSLQRKLTFPFLISQPFHNYVWMCVYMDAHKCVWGWDRIVIKEIKDT